MKIESIIRRKKGTTVTMQGESYHFTPDSEGRHVADVNKKAHLAKFLAIPEGYRLVLDDEEHNQPAPAPVIEKPIVLPEMNAESTGDAVNDKPPVSEGKDKHGRSQALVDQFVDKFGRVPHQAWDDERISLEIKEA